MSTRLSDVGEKALISRHIRPLFNPSGRPESIGDDCALIGVGDALSVCITTDRVPADLISFRLGLIDYRGLGYYLAVLNFSDIAASGGELRGLLLNLAFPPDFLLDDFLGLLEGVRRASEEYGAPVLGGDLSTAPEMNLVATAVGTVKTSQALLRSTARPGDLVFCSDTIGITPTSFTHHLRPRSEKIELSTDELELLACHFVKPTARVALGKSLSQSGSCTSAMDVTDGVAQTLSEIADASNVAITISAERLPIAPLSRKIAVAYQIDVMDLVLGAGADFQLIGTVNPNHPDYPRIVRGLHIIGDVSSGDGLYLVGEDRATSRVIPRGWNYFKPTSFTGEAT